MAVALEQWRPDQPQQSAQWTEPHTGPPGSPHHLWNKHAHRLHHRQEKAAAIHSPHKPLVSVVWCKTIFFFKKIVKLSNLLHAYFEHVFFHKIILSQRNILKCKTNEILDVNTGLCWERWRCFSSWRRGSYCRFPWFPGLKHSRRPGNLTALPAHQKTLEKETAPPLLTE